MTKTKSFVWGMRAIATFVERDFGTNLIYKTGVETGLGRPLKPFGQLRPSRGIVRFLRMLRLLMFLEIVRFLKRFVALM